jgi:hypothetical protein
MEASSYGYIKGIKVTGSELTGDFIVTIHDKLPVEGGRIVYYSALITNILWDIMTIPFSDVSGSDSMYVTIDNQGIATNFNVQIYIAKP